MLAQIEEFEGVKEAWMSRDGTMIVVVPNAGSDEAPAIEEILKKGKTKPVRLEGLNFDTVLEMFAERKDWVRAGSTDALTAEEAVQVARRIAARVHAQVPLDEEARNNLEMLLRRTFVDELPDWEARVLKDAEVILTPDALAALKTSLSQGNSPLEGEK